MYPSVATAPPCRHVSRSLDYPCQPHVSAPKPGPETEIASRNAYARVATWPGHLGVARTPAARAAKVALANTFVALPCVMHATLTSCRTS